MGITKNQSDDIKKLNARMHQLVDEFTVTMKHEESEPEKVKSSMNDLEDNFKECILDTVNDCYKEQHPELTPLLEKERDALRRRGNRPPALEVEDPETQEPEESFCDKVLRWFHAMLQRLQAWWQKFVAWVKEMVAAVVHAAKALWNVFESFCCSLPELLRSFFQY
ncbi:interleukin-32-like [Sapajus apella]|uniref:Interleukin-32-like n=1 Tax=Sapajus apella TaxID=9515 RepID=A0A6J3HGA5_SAPAP|nr:interleukin-32-like [Sapajus apella]